MAERSTRESSLRSSGTRRPRKHDKDRYGEIKEDTREAVKPDVSQLRALREAYFGGGKRHVPVKKARSRVASSRARSVHGSTRVKPVQREPLRSTKSEPRNRIEEYVYHTANTAYQTRDGRRRSTRSQELSQSSRSTSPELTDEEVAPDDSISQVAGRAARRRRSTLHRGTLRSIPERTVPTRSIPPPASNSVSTKDKRMSGFWGSIFTRQTPTKVSAPKFAECLTCGSDDIPAAKAVKLDCGHSMCHSCVRRVFKLSVQDPAHMPPKCCTNEPIPLKQVGPLFDLRFKLLYNKKLDEYNTKNRVYCPNRRCGVWIRPSSFTTSDGRKVAKCHKCGTKACIHCNQKLHKSRDCPKDPEIVKLVAQAEKAGWKRCYNCNAMVERKEGCNHMTCRCLAEFCIVCGKKWKTCDCAWFNDTAAPDFDRLEGMGLPEPIGMFFNRVRAAYDGFVAEPAVEEVPVPPRPAQRGYRAEQNRRRRQEADDAELARRMQFAAFD